MLVAHVQDGRITRLDADDRPATEKFDEYFAGTARK